MVEVTEEPNIDKNAFTFSRVGWVEMISTSIPEHCEDVKNNFLEAFKDDNGLETVDAYACAMAAAIANMNGELAFEIEMDPAMIGTEERTAVKTAVSIAALMATHLDASDNLGDTETEFTLGEWKKNTQVDEIKVGMYVYAAAVALRSRPLISEYSQLLQAAGLNIEQLRAIVKIVAVTSSLNKIAI